MLKAVACTTAYFIGPAGYPIAVGCAVSDEVDNHPDEGNV